MSNKTNVAALREHLETLFPGKWLLQTSSHRSVLTGLPQIDHGITHGLMRRRIAEWAGSESSGKSTVLRSIISNWCAVGFYVVYIDAWNKLFAADWAFVDKGAEDLRRDVHNASQQISLFAQAGNLFVHHGADTRAEKKGKFLVVRNLKEQDLLWSAEQLVRSNIFDVVILDMGNSSALGSRAYARLQRALDRSKSAFVLMKDEFACSASSNLTWGCDSKFKFFWSRQVECQMGLLGSAAIQPAIEGTVSRDGVSQNMEVSGIRHVPNRLFTHPQVPDRRVPKPRAGA
jgi:hypothetical protein